MYGIIVDVKVDVSREEDARKMVREIIAPRAKTKPGFVAGYWTRKDYSGLGMVIFESEDAAQAMIERVPSMVPDVVTLENIEVREVVAHA